MTIGIYCIVNKIDFKRYIGKSIKIEARIWYHKNSLVKPIYHKDCNRHLYNAVQKYGIDSFTFEILEQFEIVDDDKLKNAELKWIDHYRSCERQFGYNLRRDSSSQSFVHEETLKLMSLSVKGNSNPNYGNRWNEDQKKSMSQKQIERHSTGEFYDKEWKKKLGEKSSLSWRNENLKKQMAASVSKAKSTHDFYKFDLAGDLLKVYASIAEITNENPNFKWQNIYAACNGSKSPVYRGFLWARVPKNCSTS